VSRMFNHPVCCDRVREIGHEVYFIKDGSVRVKIGGESSSHSPHADYCTFCGKPFPTYLREKWDIVRVRQDGKPCEPFLCDGPFDSVVDAMERIKKRGDRRTDYTLVPATKERP